MSYAMLVTRLAETGHGFPKRQARRDDRSYESITAIREPIPNPRRKHWIAAFSGRTVIYVLSILPLLAVAAYGADPLTITKPAKGLWPEKWESAVSEAKKEGKVTIYGQVGPELRVALTAAIKKDLGLDLDLVPGSGRTVLTRFATEARAGIPSADILLGGPNALRTAPDLYTTWDNLEQQLILPDVLDSKNWPNGKLPFLDKQKKILPLALEVSQYLVVNTNIVKPGQIKAYRDLLQPQWKGKIGMFDPTGGGTGTTWVGLIMTKVYKPPEGEIFLRKFALQEPVFTKDSRLQSEWVARGRYPVSIALDQQAAYQMQKTGAPIARLAAEEGGILTGGGSYLVMPVKRPHPHAAAVVFNWLLSARGQEIYSKGYGAPAARLGTKTDGLSQMALPLPGEKLFVQDEEFALFTDEAMEISKRIFTAPK